MSDLPGRFLPSESPLSYMAIKAVARVLQPNWHGTIHAGGGYER